MEQGHHRQVLRPIDIQELINLFEFIAEICYRESIVPEYIGEEIENIGEIVDNAIDANEALLLIYDITYRQLNSLKYAEKPCITLL